MLESVKSESKPKVKIQKLQFLDDINPNLKQDEDNCNLELPPNSMQRSPNNSFQKKGSNVSDSIRSIRPADLIQSEENELNYKDKEKECQNLGSIGKDEMPEIQTQETKHKTVTQWLNLILDHWITTIFFSVVTLWVLFADDVKSLTTTVYYDDYFSALNTLFMALFGLEFFVSCIAVQDYFLSFFFWLDMISFLSMIFDISWFYDWMIESLGDSSSGNSGSKIKSAAKIAKAGRGARVGSRAVKILRILRIIRLVRIAKLYKASQKFDKTKEKENDIVILEESKVGKKLTDLTTKRVIILVLSMIIGVILFNSSFYYKPMTSMDFGLKIFNYYNSPTDPGLLFSFELYLDEHKNISTPILYLIVANNTWGENIENDLRIDEKLISSEDCTNLQDPNSNDTALCYAVFDNRSLSNLTSILNIVKTIFICFALAGGSICFSKDTSEMVVEPIESMIEKIEKISKNPIEAMEENEKEDYLKMIDKKQNKGTCCNKKKNEVPLETLVLEKTITKIGALLALGFGDAGARIVINNMSNTEEAEINPMIKGKKVMALYGFCDIRNFTETTEVLEEQVMVYVNEIAEIVHEITFYHGGAANKNIGDAFLLVWKFDNELCEFDNNNEVIGLKKNKVTSEIVDNVLISFIKILTKIQTSHKLDKYRKNSSLNNKIKNFSVKIGLGLHLGWSIEGAIGSTFKIDASYLSPHVNISGKLEEKTKEYGTPILISSSVATYMSDEARRNLRIVDKLNLIEGEELELYTIDLDLGALKIEQPPMTIDESTKDVLSKYQKKNMRKERMTQIMKGTTTLWAEFEETFLEWTIIRGKYSRDFFDKYNFGYSNFIKGNWSQSKVELEACQKMLGEADRPSVRILGIMGKHNFILPLNWNAQVE